MQLVSKILNLCDYSPPTSQTDRQMTRNRKTTLCTIVHRTVKMQYKLQTTQHWLAELIKRESRPRHTPHFSRLQQQPQRSLTAA